MITKFNLFEKNDFKNKGFKIGDYVFGKFNEEFSDDEKTNIFLNNTIGEIVYIFQYDYEKGKIIKNFIDINIPGKLETYCNVKYDFIPNDVIHLTDEINHELNVMSLPKHYLRLASDKEIEELYFQKDIKNFNL